MLSIGTATQDVFLVGKKVFTPVKGADGKLFEHIPLGAKLDLDDVVFSTGGNASNAAVTFARAGLDSMFMGVAGTDPAGQAVMSDLDREEVDTRYVHQQDKYRTAYSTLLLAPNGERTVLRYGGHSLSDTGRELELKAISEANWLYVSSVGSIELLEKIISRAAGLGVQVAYNPSPLELKQPAKLRALLEDVSVLIANKEEMSLLVEGKNLEELARHATNVVSIAAVTDGMRGSVTSDGKWLIKAGMYENVPIVDRTGAGDAYGSGLVAMLAQGKSLAEATLFASANATSVVTEIGAKAAILAKGARLHTMPLTINKV